MKTTDYIAIIVIIILTYLFVNNKLNPDRIVDRDTTYIQGELVIDTLWKDSIVYMDKWQTILDTLYVDSNGTHAKADFNFNKDSVEVKGKVYFDTPMFSFSHLQVKYPYRTISTTRIDTFRISVTKMPSFSHSFGGGFGYGLIHKEFDFYVGYGFQINF